MRKKKIQFISKYRSSSLLHEPFKITLGLSYEKCVSCEKSLPKGTHCWRRFDDYNPVSHWCLPCGNIKFETTEPVINSPKVNTQPKKESRPKKNKKPKKPGIFSKIFAEKIQTPGKNDNDDLEKISGKEWPNILNMEIAIENIKNTTLDNDLQNLKIELDEMDLPYQIQGAAAVIYKGGFAGKKVALKLFTSRKLGEMKRYDSLSTYFDSKKIFSNCNYFTNFKYVPRAIEIKLTTPENEGKTDLFPIIKMDWIEGKILEEFIKETDDQDKIKKLSENFLKMVNTLEDLKIAHGDLHPKNILVDDELNLKLVDYDCIYIDEFKGTEQPELGDPDCQHPNRKHFEYNTKIDYFSNLVIYLALVAISEDLKLKSHKSTGDFIFSKKDFVDPSKSELFQKLENMGSKVSILCKELKKYCKSDRPQMRSLKVILMAEKDKDMEEN